LLVCDGTRAHSLETALRLKNSVDQRYGSMPFVLLINKSDLIDKWQIKKSDIEKLKSQGFEVFITSAKLLDENNVEEAFAALTKKISDS